MAYECDWCLDFEFSGKAGEIVKARVAPQCDFTKEKALSEKRLTVVSLHVITSKLVASGVAEEVKERTNRCRANQVFEMEAMLHEDISSTSPACATLYGKAKL